ncbi:MAG: LacI family DNA-binding transcriptional regulator [Acidothermaceae bacterium]
MSTGDRRRVTIADIAEEAGVSVPTVSRVLNGRMDVAPETRNRIEELLQRHEYRRRGTPRGGQASLIDLVFNDLDSPWAVEIIRGVEDVAHDVGVGVVVSAVHSQAMSERRWWQNVQARASDGVILVTSHLNPRLQAELRRHLPTVVVDPAGVPSVDLPTIGATNWAGGLSATEHLVGLGHRRIGVISGPPRLQCSRARLDGYRTGLDAAGIHTDDDLVYQGDFYHESGFAGANKLLALDHPPTAIFASSDQMAFGVYEAARQHGLRVPTDLSIVGFDDLPEARWASPPLTTVRQPLSEMGMLAARTVLRIVRGEEIETMRFELATQLVVRESTAAPDPGRK